jgi:hypothetical protein
VWQAETGAVDTTARPFRLTATTGARLTLRSLQQFNRVPAFSRFDTRTLYDDVATVDAAPMAGPASSGPDRTARCPSPPEPTHSRITAPEHSGTAGPPLVSRPVPAVRNTPALGAHLL